MKPAGFQDILMLILRTETVVEGLVTVMRTGTWIEAVDGTVAVAF